MADADTIKQSIAEASASAISGFWKLYESVRATAEAAASAEVREPLLVALSESRGEILAVAAHDRIDEQAAWCLCRPYYRGLRSAALVAVDCCRRSGDDRCEDLEETIQEVDAITHDFGS